MYMIGKAGLPQLQQIQGAIARVGMILAPDAWQTPTCPYALDNGVYGAFLKGRTWDQEMHCAWLGMLAKVPADIPPLWVLLPDAVADWPRTVELAELYAPVVRSHGWPVAIALQDGCDFDQVLEFAPDWVFLAGSTEWKERNIDAVCRFFQPLGICVHVGRVNTRRRIMLCQAAGVDSCDGTTLNKYRDATLPLVRDTLAQSCMVMQ